MNTVKQLQDSERTCLMLPVPAAREVLVAQDCFNVPDNQHVINQLLHFCRCPCCSLLQGLTLLDVAKLKAAV